MRALLATVLVAVLAGCQTGTKVTQEDIAAAESRGELDALYVQVERELAQEGAKPSETTQLVLAQIGTRLASQLESELDAKLAEARTPSGQVPLVRIAEARERSAPMERWAPEKYRELGEKLDGLAEQTRAAISEREQRLADLPQDAFGKRSDLVLQLEQLSGEGTEEAARWRAERDGIRAALEETAEEAIQAEDYATAQAMLQAAQKLDPSDVSVESKLVEVDGKLFELGFFQALESGQPDEAYRMLSEISQSSNFPSIRSGLSDTADPMASYFVELADQATRDGNLADAYRLFVQAREIRRLLGKGQSAMLPEESRFVDVIKKHYWDARKKEENPGLAWAYLSVVKSLEPSSPSLRRMERETREDVVKRAIKRLGALPFETSEAGQEFGEAVASKLVEYLFRSVPNDLEILEREALQKIIKEAELGGELELLAVDYLVEGDILEARVDTTRETGQNTRRVVTGEVTKPNPKHEYWKGLSRGERADTPEPPETITVKNEEMVSYDVTMHRKVGVFEVSYRIVEAGSARVRFADSVRRKAEHSDTSTGGVQIGDFKVPFKMANLPSDLEILGDLADAVSEEIGRRLSEELDDPEFDYEQIAMRYASEGNFAEASEQFAYADVLSQRKGKDVSDLRRRMNEAAIASIEPRSVAAARKR